MRTTFSTSSAERPLFSSKAAVSIGKVDGLEAHVAFDLGAVDLAGRVAAICGGSVLGEDRERIESGIFAGRLVAGRKRHLDLHERHVADDVAVADLRDHRHFHAPPVLGAGDLARRRKPRGLGVFAGLRRRRQAVSFMISGGVASCSRPSSAASSATPIRMLEVTPVRNVPESQRAEISRLSGGPLRPSAISGGSLPSSAMASSVSCIQKGGFFPCPFRLSYCCRDICLPRGRSQRRPGSRSRGFALSIPLHAMRDVAARRPLEEAAPLSAGNGAAIGLHCGAADRGAKPLTLRHADAASEAQQDSSQKIQKTSNSVLTPGEAGRLYTPHNEGGAPLATKEFALVKSKRAA